MKGVVFRSKDRTPALEDVHVKAPGAGEVRVRLHAAGLCHSDLSVIDGSIPYPAPVVLGHEGAGIVEAIGPEVTGLEEGDPVVLSTLAHCDVVQLTGALSLPFPCGSSGGRSRRPVVRVRP